MKTTAILNLAAIAATLALAHQVQATTITADFDGGNSTTVVDAWSGMSGDGWSGAWAYKSNAVTTFTRKAITSADAGYTPLTNTSGSYLSVSVTSNSNATTSRQAAIRRTLDTGGSGVDLNKTFSISFLFRPDTTFTDPTQQQYFMFANDSTSQYGTSSGDTWEIMSSSAISSTWIVGGANTNITVVQGNVYSFVINTNPVSSSYTVTVKDLTANVSFTSESLSYRSGSVTTESPILYFGARGTANSNKPSYTTAFSLDSISVTQVPEPASLGVAAFGAGLLIARKRRA